MCAALNFFRLMNSVFANFHFVFSRIRFLDLFFASVITCYILCIQKQNSIMYDVVKLVKLWCCFMNQHPATSFQNAVAHLTLKSKHEVVLPRFCLDDNSYRYWYYVKISENNTFFLQQMSLSVIFEQLRLRLTLWNFEHFFYIKMII